MGLRPTPQYAYKLGYTISKDCVIMDITTGITNRTIQPSRLKSSKKILNTLWGKECIYTN